MIIEIKKEPSVEGGLLVYLLNAIKRLAEFLILLHYVSVGFQAYDHNGT
jgi:hypothetical protein